MSDIPFAKKRYVNPTEGMGDQYEDTFECKWDAVTKQSQIVFALGYARGKEKR